jgi:hypothetical protein
LSCSPGDLYIHTDTHVNSAEQQLALPLDLVVRFGICQLHLDKLPSALQCFASLRQRVRARLNACNPVKKQLISTFDFFPNK